MEREGLVVINLDNIAARWQIPVKRIQFFITDCGMDPLLTAKWVEENQELFLAEKQKAFEDSLFPQHLRPEPMKSTS